MLNGMVRLPSRDVSLFIRELGAGYPVLLMHGGPGADHSTLDPLRPLAESCRLIAYDHRCNGLSRRIDIRTMTWENLAADAEAIREHLGIEELGVIGHSFGGMVALEYATRYPAGIRKLVLMDTCGDSSWVRMRAPEELARRGFSMRTVEAARRFYSGRIHPHELKRMMVRLGGAYYSSPRPMLLLREALHGLKIRASPEAFIGGFRDLMPGWSVMDRLNGISCPTLILAGSDDFQFPPEHQEELRKGIPRSELHIVAGAGHNPHVEKPEETLRLIRGFLKASRA